MRETIDVSELRDGSLDLDGHLSVWGTHERSDHSVSAQVGSRHLQTVVELQHPVTLSLEIPKCFLGVLKAIDLELVAKKV